MMETENDTSNMGDDGSVKEIQQTKMGKKFLHILENKDNESWELLIGEWSDGMDPNGRNKND